MRRRDFIEQLVAGSALFLVTLAGCGRDEQNPRRSRFARPHGTVTLYDTNAMALYFDGGLGPKTGVIKVDYLLANQPVTLQFWHGHGGKSHAFTVTPEHFSELKKLKKVMLETTTVADHAHKLFIDPVDPRWRVAGAPPVEVPTDGARA